jgi:hypothetical protein
MRPRKKTSQMNMRTARRRMHRVSSKRLAFQTRLTTAARGSAHQVIGMFTVLSACRGTGFGLAEPVAI